VGGVTFAQFCGSIEQSFHYHISIDYVTCNLKKLCAVVCKLQTDMFAVVKSYLTYMQLISDEKFVSSCSKTWQDRAILVQVSSLQHSYKHRIFLTGGLSSALEGLPADILKCQMTQIWHLEGSWL